MADSLEKISEEKKGRVEDTRLFRLVEMKQGFTAVPCDLRNHLNKFKGAQLAVFLAIATHANKDDGKAFPSLQTLVNETGYSRNAVSKAITGLCELRINGHRVLLAYQDRLQESNPKKNGNFRNNTYVICPSAEEVKMYETNNPLARQARAKPDAALSL